MDFQGFLETLPIMGEGLAGIFIVMLVIGLTVVALTKLTKPKKEQE